MAMECNSARPAPPHFATNPTLGTLTEGDRPAFQCHRRRLPCGEYHPSAHRTRKLERWTSILAQQRCRNRKAERYICFFAGRGGAAGRVSLWHSTADEEDATCYRTAMTQAIRTARLSSCMVEQKMGEPQPSLAMPVTHLSSAVHSMAASEWSTWYIPRSPVDRPTRNRDGWNGEKATDVARTLGFERVGVYVAGLGSAPNRERLTTFPLPAATRKRDGSVGRNATSKAAGPTSSGSAESCRISEHEHQGGNRFVFELEHTKTALATRSTHSAAGHIRWVPEERLRRGQMCQCWRSR